MPIFWRRSALPPVESPQGASIGGARFLAQGKIRMIKIKKLSKLRDIFRTVVVTWGGLGFLPWAPGTWGSLGAFPLYFLLLSWTSFEGMCLTLALITLLSWVAIKSYLREKTSRHDPQEIVVDEVVGQLIALSPAGLNPGLMVTCFLLFRFFDIVKPWPISWADRLRGSTHLLSFGVLLDDILAGSLTAFCVWAWLQLP